MTKLTILITNYNKEKHVSYNIELLKQKITDEIEVQIYDDGSTDESVDIIKQMVSEYEGNNIKTYFLTENHGIGAVREMALNNVNTDYFIFVDSDDLLTENYIEKILSYINKSPNVDIHHFGVRSYPDGGTLCISFSLWDKVLRTSFIRNNDIHFDKSLRGHEDEAFMDLVWNCNPKVETHYKDVLYIYNGLVYNTITHDDLSWYHHENIKKEFE